MIALISFLLVVGFSLFIVKLGSIALQTTGLSKDVADFQAQSAFSGVGFTTSESESIVNNPVRRKILRFLMLLGSAGLTTAIATLVLTFTTAKQSFTLFGYVFGLVWWLDVGVVLCVVWFLFGISRMQWYDNGIRWLFRVPLKQLKQHVYLYDYEGLLALSKGYTIATFTVPSHHWMSNKTISQLRIKKEGIVILGIARKVRDKEEFIGSPSLQFKVKHGDKITVYGQQDIITDIARRPVGPKGTLKAKESVKKAQILKEVKKLDEKRLSELAEIDKKP